MRALFNRFLRFHYALSYYLNWLRISDIEIEDYIQRHLRNAPKYQDPKRLGVYEFQMFSQSGADGIVAEIFRRIGTSNKFFVEFGVGNGLENNTAALLLARWAGLWIECSDANQKSIQQEFREFIEGGKLASLAAMITKENLVSLFQRGQVPHEFDLLSIDVDGNDYWFWQELMAHYSPRVAVIEYNAQLGPSLPWIMTYDADHAREAVVSTTYYGASLKALEQLGNKHGYSLVGCDFLGMNAFFVRNDLVNDRFCAPFTSENHFEPSRLFLYRRNGHPRKIGRFVTPE